MLGLCDRRRRYLRHPIRSSSRVQIFFAPVERLQDLCWMLGTVLRVFSFEVAAPFRSGYLVTRKKWTMHRLEARVLLSMIALNRFRMWSVNEFLQILTSSMSTLRAEDSTYKGAGLLTSMLTSQKLCRVSVEYAEIAFNSAKGSWREYQDVFWNNF